MGCKPDEWARKWLEQKRAEDPEGVRGWTLEKHGGSHYIKWGTTVWDPEAKKYRKRTRHVGTLNPNGTVTKARQRAQAEPAPPPIGVRDYGDAAVLEKASESIAGPLEECFPDTWRELLALAEARVLGEPRLCRLGDVWRLLDDTRGLGPRTSADALSRALEAAGGDSAAQERFFDAIDPGDGHVAVDLSVVFSRSEGVSMLRKGYNRFGLQCQQFNLAAVCSIGDGRPTRLCMVCGNVKEGSLEGMIGRFGLPADSVLVMDRGYGSRKVLDAVVGAGHGFVVALRRDSLAYRDVEVGEGHFTWEGRAVNYGRGRFWGHHAYRFEDLSLRADEVCDRYKAEEDGGRAPKDLDRAGNVMILSSLNIDPYQIYRMYKMRCAVENFFDTSKNDLRGDSTYLGSDRKVMGYNLVTFLAYRIWWEVRSWLEGADLCSRYSPEDVLRKFSAVKVYYTDNGPVLSDVPKDVREIGRKIGLELQPGYIPQKT